MSKKFTPIHKLGPSDEVDAFSSGQAELDLYLKRFAWQNQRAGSANTYVINVGNSVIGFYSLTVGSVEFNSAPARVAKGLARHQVPVMLLARLAVCQEYQNQGLGQALLKDALLRTLQASDIAGIRALLVHAKNENVRSWYMHFNFQPSPSDPLHLFLLIKDIAHLLK